MISKRELKYVDEWARMVPMPGYNYSIEILKEIKEAYELYNKIYKDKEYSMIFSNSEEIDFEIQTKNLCHMLGIDNKNINNDYCKDYRKEVFGSEEILPSYEFLIAVIENMEKIAILDNDASNNIKVMNYYKSAVKCQIFKKISDFNKFNFGVINYNDQKYFFVPSNESLTPYFIIGIKKDDDSKYFVNTLLAPINPKEYFENNEVMIPTQIIISDESKLNKILATPEEKLNLLTMYSNIINMYGLKNNMNIMGDYESVLNYMNNTKILRR